MAESPAICGEFSNVTQMLLFLCSTLSLLPRYGQNTKEVNFEAMRLNRAQVVVFEVIWITITYINLYISIKALRENNLLLFYSNSSYCSKLSRIHVCCNMRWQIKLTGKCKEFAGMVIYVGVPFSYIFSSVTKLMLLWNVACRVQGSYQNIDRRILTILTQC